MNIEKCRRRLFGDIMYTLGLTNRGDNYFIKASVYVNCIPYDFFFFCFYLLNQFLLNAW